MGGGIGIGKLLPGLTDGLRNLEFGRGSQINVPIALLIWLMITAMMMKVDFASVTNVGKNPRGLVITLVVNWLVKPSSMALLAWIFFRYLRDCSLRRMPTNTSRVRVSWPRHLALAWCLSGAILPTATPLTR